MNNAADVAQRALQLGDACPPLSAIPELNGQSSPSTGLPAGVTEIDSRGFFAIPAALSKEDPNVRYFCIEEAKNFATPGSLIEFQIIANCAVANLQARGFSIPMVAGRTSAATHNPDGHGFHLTGQYPGEQEIHFADVLTLDPVKFPTVAAYLAYIATAPDYVPPLTRTDKPV